ncbi:RNHCP domain-containing protein, partial [Dysosmobacter welbionis]
GPAAGAPGALCLSTFPLSRDHGGAGAASGSPGPGRMGAGLSGGPVPPPRQILLRPPPQGTPRGPFAGSYLPGALCRTGTDQAPLFPHQDAGTAPLSGCPGTARGVGEALLLQDAGGENESDSPPADRGSGASLH